MLPVVLPIVPMVRMLLLLLLRGVIRVIRLDPVALVIVVRKCILILLVSGWLW